MNQHIEHAANAGIYKTSDGISCQQAEVGSGGKLLRDLTSVHQTPALTFRNVLKATDTFTTLNCVALIFTYTAALMEYSIPTSQIPFIIEDLGKPELASWLATASTCATATILPSMSSITDITGRRYALLVGSALGTAGALVAGFAPTTEIVILGQALSGAGVGFTFVSAASVAEMVPAFTRPFWGTLQHSMGNFMGLIGPVYAGALVRANPNGGWRWMFWINGIFYGISLILVFFLYKEKSRVRALGLTRKEVVKKFDYVGLLLFTGGTLAFLCGLAWGGDSRYGWNTAHAIAPAVVGSVALVIALPLYEVYVAKWPLIDRSLFRYRNFIILNIQTFVIGFVQFSTFVYLPQILLAFWETDPLLLGVDRLPLGGATFVALMGAGFVFQKTGTGKWAYIAYAFLLLLGPALCAVLRPNQHIGVPLGISVITGLGVGGATSLGFIIIQYSIPQQFMGIGIGCLTTLRSFGGSVGVAIYNSILRSKQLSTGPSAIATAAISAGVAQGDVTEIVQAVLSGSREAITQATGGNIEVVSAVTTAYQGVLADSYMLVFLTTIPFGTISLIITFWLKEVTQYLSNETVFGLQREGADSSVVAGGNEKGGDRNPEV